MGNNKGMMIIIIVLLLVLMGAIVGGAIFIVSNLNNGGGYTAGAAAPPGPLGLQDIRVHQLRDAVATNLMQGPGGGQHVARVEVGLGINNTDEDAATEFIREHIDGNEIVISDAVSRILRRTTFEQINRVDSQDVLAEDILAALQAEFGSNMIVRVFLTLFAH